MKKFLMSLAFAALSTISYGQELDLKQELTEYMGRHFIGQRADVTKKWDNSSCVARNPITGKCIEEGGFNIEAKGWGKIDGFRDSSGNFSLISFQSSSGPIVIFNSDLFINYDYYGETSAQKILFPGGVFGGWEWGTVNPRGRVEMRIVTKPGENFQMYFNYFAYAGNDDKPNTVVREAIMALQNNAKNILVNYLKTKGYVSEVKIGSGSW